MSSLFRSRRLVSLSAICCRSEGIRATHLDILLRNFPFPSTRLLSSVEQKLQEHGQDFAVSCPENPCGPFVETADSNSGYTQFDSEPDSGVSLLKNYGFTADQISKVVKSYPKLLSPGVKMVIFPKLEFLSSIGLSGSDITKIVSSNPRTLSLTLNSQLVPLHNFLKSIVGCDEMVVKIIKRAPRLLMANFHNNISTKVSFLREVGLTDCVLAKLLEYGPQSFSVSFAKFKSGTEKVMSFGFKPSNWMFVPAFRAVIQTNESTWDRKIRVYQSWGLSTEDIHSAFMKQPICMIISEEKITKVMDFLLNKMGFESSDIAKHPITLLLSLEKRIVPRCSVVDVLCSKGIVTKDFASYHRVWIMTEKTFLKTVVHKYPEYVLELWNGIQKKAAP